LVSKDYSILAERKYKQSCEIQVDIFCVYFHQEMASNKLFRSCCTFDGRKCQKHEICSPKPPVLWNLGYKRYFKTCWAQILTILSTSSRYFLCLFPSRNGFKRII
jgi:hypothetical protein